MDRETVMSMLSLIPERTARRQSGTTFEAREGRTASLARFLSWLSPLNPTSKEDQAAIGYTVAQPRAEEHEPEGDDASEEEGLAPAEPESEPSESRQLQESEARF
jgi:hypothetical protein